MNERQELEATARIEIVPFPSADDVSASIDASTVESDLGTESRPDDPSVMRSKLATGWAASGLAGALRRSSRRRGET